MGRLFAAGLIGMPAGLLVAVLVSAGGSSEPPSTAIVYGNPYASGSAAGGQYRSGYDFAAALAEQGEAASGMADDGSRWCRDRLTPSAGFTGEVTEAVMQGCIEGSKLRTVRPSHSP